MSSITQTNDRKHWVSRSHEAILSPSEPDQLLVWRKDGKPLGTERFSVLQSFKNAVFGAETIAVEVYPPQSELRDRANIYWLHRIDRPQWLKKQNGSIADKFTENYS